MSQPRECWKARGYAPAPRNWLLCLLIVPRFYYPWRDWSSSSTSQLVDNIHPIQPTSSDIQKFAFLQSSICWDYNSYVIKKKKVTSYRCISEKSSVFWVWAANPTVLSLLVITQSESHLIPGHFKSATSKALCTLLIQAIPSIPSSFNSSSLSTHFFPCSLLSSPKWGHAKLYSTLHSLLSGVFQGLHCCTASLIPTSFMYSVQAADPAMVQVTACEGGNATFRTIKPTWGLPHYSNPLQ